MNSHTPSLAEVEARVSKLERESREGGHPSAAPPPAMPTGSYDTLVVHRLELRDKAGKLRGVWTVSDEGPGLWLHDAAGKPRAALALNAKDPGLVLYDAAGKPRAGLAVTAAGPGLGLLDTAGNPRAQLTEDGLLRR